MTSSKLHALHRITTAMAVLGSLVVCAGQAQAATIVINNLNAPGVGFNDTTPALPVGGNTGTTLGQQRLIAFTYAANIWGATLTSSQPIIINAQFSALSCTATSGVLGSAGATNVFSNFPGAPRTNTWYSYALANKIAGVYLGTANAPQINANFNVNLGTTGCLQTSSWYYGLDSNEPVNGIDFVAVLQHEMAHGLGFQTFTNGTTGAFLGTSPNIFPAIWDHFLFSTAANKTWADATAAERVASAISVNGLVWTGANVTSAVPSVLLVGSPNVAINGVAAGPAAGNYAAGEASFGPLPTPMPVSGDVMPVVEQTAGAGEGCEPFNAVNTAAVRNNIALIARGVCGFAIKAKNAQNAGARGVIISDNAAGAVTGLGGTDPTVTIPAVRVTLATGNTIREQLKRRSRTGSGVVAGIGRIGTQYAGADIVGRMLMFAPNPFQSGSSVSHYDTTATPNLLMEPSINGNLTQLVGPPKDLTLPLFTDIGW
jgi:PA domain